MGKDKAAWRVTQQRDDLSCCMRRVSSFLYAADMRMLDCSHLTRGVCAVCCRNTDVPIDPETAEPVEMDTPNEVCAAHMLPQHSSSSSIRECAYAQHSTSSSRH
jgi:hypothetical protein